MSSSYPPPDSPRAATRTSYPPLLPIYPPPPSALPTPLPSAPPPQPFPNPAYTVSTHLVPAAYLRSTPPAPPPPPPAAASAPKAERQAQNALRVAWVAAQAAGPRGRHARVLWSAVNRYVRTDAADGRGAGRTLFLAHANGFPKEVWEPALLDLLARPGPGGAVDEVWAWEATHHGASCVLNLAAGVPLAACDWADDARDVLNFLLHFLPSEIAPGAPLPAHLPRVAPEESALRKIRGFSERALFAAGHSFGGACCTWAALTYPRLFTALTLVDPVIVRFGTPLEPGPSLADGAVARRDGWPSREAAHAAFAASPFFGAWDARVLAAYVAHGLVPAPGGGGDVRLAMPPLQEALVFAGTPSAGRVWDLLPTLEARVPLLWVVPGRAGEPEIGGPGATRERVWRRPANASNVRVAQAGHLIVQEAPQEMARQIAGMLAGEWDDKAVAKL
ncbi:Alpha/beta hydrolase family-domain-containing protein [Mycena rosella]|uniref:Alpha/beta hydrolase family-domain-containing protein n=1 Tax=Mycena rosella TaxID=1033263 RepID=A0AAD7H1C7_MYCRO|nr:Alpha/beta hydrolase family-domain-containing protein [Mycena rosella]